MRRGWQALPGCAGPQDETVLMGEMVSRSQAHVEWRVRQGRRVRRAPQERQALLGGRKTVSMAFLCQGAPVRRGLPVRRARPVCVVPQAERAKTVRMASLCQGHVE